MIFLNRFFGQKPKQGAWPALFAATAKDVKGVEYFGSGRYFELNGHLKKDESNNYSHNQETAKKLWEISENHQSKIQSVTYEPV